MQLVKWNSLKDCTVFEGIHFTNLKGGIIPAGIIPGGMIPAGIIPARMMGGVYTQQIFGTTYSPLFQWG